MRRRSWWLLVASGVALGVVFATRPFDAVLWAVAMGGYAIFTTWREWDRQLRAVVLVFVGFLPFLILALVQNRIVTGSFTQFPFTAKEPLDTFGFGYRKLMPSIVGMRLHRWSGGARDRGQLVLRPAVPGGELRGAAGRRRRVVAAPA